jgi:sugar phosphate isomerase/epimerase
LTVSTLASPDWTLEETVLNYASSGVKGIDFRGIKKELDITAIPEFGQDLQHTLEMLRAHGLSMPCLNTSVTLMTLDAGKWTLFLQEAERYVRLASATGTPYLRIFGGLIPKEFSRSRALELARKHLAEVIEKTRGTQCRVLVETHDDWSSSAEILSLLEPFSTDPVAVLWDLDATHRKGEAPEQVVASLGKRIGHVHVKDGLSIDGRHEPKLLGDGDVPIVASVNALERLGYDGWYCLESEKRWEPSAAEPSVCIPQFVSFMSQFGRS